jgi:hypothetical protein
MNIHVCVNYKADPHTVFVEWSYRGWGLGWKMLTRVRAVKEKRRIIKCSKCARAAKLLDHLWPYATECNLCGVHLKKPEARKP